MKKRPTRHIDMFRIFNEYLCTLGRLDKRISNSEADVSVKDMYRLISKTRSYYTSLRYAQTLQQIVLANTENKGKSNWEDFAQWWGKIRRG